MTYRPKSAHTGSIERKEGQISQKSLLMNLMTFYSENSPRSYEHKHFHSSHHFFPPFIPDFIKIPLFIAQSRSLSSLLPLLHSFPFSLGLSIVYNASCMFTRFSTQLFSFLVLCSWQFAPFESFCNLDWPFNSFDLISHSCNFFPPSITKNRSFI